MSANVRERRVQLHPFLWISISGSVACWSQGSVNFTNHDPVEGVNAPFSDYQGQLLTGPTYVAQLYAGITAQSLTPVGSSVSFLAPPSGAGYFSGGQVIIPFIQPFVDPVWVQVRAWAVAGGATYEQALAAGAYTGLSNVIHLPATGDPDMPSLPASLVGLQFVGVPEPAPWLLGLLGLGALAFLPRERGPAPTSDPCS